MPIINLNNDAVVKHVATLEKMHRSALPLAIRGTLNGAAFDVKKNTLHKQAQSTFTIRSRGFFRAFSRVQPAMGFDVKKMKSVVGMTDRKPGGKSEQAGRNMKQRQVGGNIPGRSLIPLDQARTSRRNSRMVRKKYRLSSMRKPLSRMVDSSKSGGSQKQRFVKAVMFAKRRYGNGALVKHTGPDGITRIYEVGQTGKKLRTRRRNVSTTPIYTYRRGRQAKAGKTSPFTFLAAKKSQKKMSRIFEENASRQFNRLRK